MSNYEFWDELGKIFNAVVAYQEKSNEFNKRFINPWIRLGNVFDKQDRSREAIEAYQKAIELDPANAQNWYELGNLYFRADAYDQAAEAFNKAIELEPQFGRAYNNLALTLVSQGKHAEAIPLYQKSIELLAEDKDKAMAWNRLGNLYRKLNEYEQAVEAFQKADELDAENAGFRDELDEMPVAPTLVKESNGSQQETESAVTGQQDAVDAHEAEPIEAARPDPMQTTPAKQQTLPAETLIGAAENVVETYTESALAAEASTELSVATTARQASAAGVGSGETVEAQAGNPKVQIETQEIVFQDEDTAGVENAEAGVQQVKEELPVSEHGAYEEFLKDNHETLDMLAVTHRDKAVEASNPPALQEPATQIDASGEFQIEMDAKNAHVWNELGNVYFNNGEYDDAIIAYSKAIELDRWFAWPYSNLALAYVQKGRLAEAILLYQRSIELFTSEKDKAVSWNRLGNVYRRLDDYENAIESYQRADELDPDNTTLSLQSRFSLLGNYQMEPSPSYAS